MPKRTPRVRPARRPRTRRSPRPGLSHFNATGDAHMVDVGGKSATEREAVAAGVIRMRLETLVRIVSDDHKKGDVLGVARIAGIQAAKKASDLIPLCHPLSLSAVEVEMEPQETPPAVHCRATVRTVGQTGVEMEALTAVHVALLTVYDMCKSVDRGMTMTDIRLLSKSGGQSGDWARDT